MTSRILQLDTDELSSVLDVINPVGLLVDELTGKAAAGRDPRPGPGGRLTPWYGTSGDPRVPATERTLFEDLPTGRRCVLPTSALHEFRAAALATLAARELVAPGVVTAAVLGSGPAAQSTLMLIARHLPGLSHAAVWPTGGAQGTPIEPRVVDRLDLAGVGWSVAAALAGAVFGATLIVTSVARVEWPEIGQLPRGTTLVNTTGDDLPADLVDAVDQIYVDDAALVERNQHRHFVRTHLAGPDADSTRFGRAGRRHRHIEADLGQVLTGGHAGRTHGDDILLVELLGTRTQDVRLAGRLHQAAIDRGLGDWLVE